jgi:hypothetical protein
MMVEELMKKWILTIAAATVLTTGAMAAQEERAELYPKPESESETQGSGMIQNWGERMRVKVDAARQLVAGMNIVTGTDGLVVGALQKQLDQLEKALCFELGTMSRIEHDAAQKASLQLSGVPQGAVLVAWTPPSEESTAAPQRIPAIERTMRGWEHQLTVVEQNIGRAVRSNTILDPTLRGEWDATMEEARRLLDEVTQLQQTITRVQQTAEEYTGKAGDALHRMRMLRADPEAIENVTRWAQQLAEVQRDKEGTDQQLDGILNRLGGQVRSCATNRQLYLGAQELTVEGTPRQERLTRYGGWLHTSLGEVRARTQTGREIYQLIQQQVGSNEHTVRMAMESVKLAMDTMTKGVEKAIEHTEWLADAIWRAADAGKQEIRRKRTELHNLIMRRGIPPAVALVTNEFLNSSRKQLQAIRENTQIIAQGTRRARNALARGDGDFQQQSED